MTLSYNRIAGKDTGRLAALSDGVFAVAMTLLVLDIRTPAPGAIHSEAELGRALIALAPRAVMYLMSFLTLGIFWVGQQTQLNNLERADRNLAWIHLAFLALVAVLPFSTSLLAEFVTYRIALMAYWLNILALGTALYAAWSYAVRAGLATEAGQAELNTHIRRRIVVAQGLYAFGAALCLINTYWSLGFIVLVQLNYALAPRLPILRSI